MMKHTKSVFDRMASKAMKMSSRATAQMRTDPESLLFPEPKKYGKKNSFSGRMFFTQALRLTLCAVILLTLLPCGQGAPVTELESLIYQENLARSKQFIVQLIIGALWG